MCPAHRAQHVADTVICTFYVSYHVSDTAVLWKVLLSHLTDEETEARTGHTAGTWQRWDLASVSLLSSAPGRLGMWPRARTTGHGTGWRTHRPEDVGGSHEEPACARRERGAPAGDRSNSGCGLHLAQEDPACSLECLGLTREPRVLSAHSPRPAAQPSGLPIFPSTLLFLARHAPELPCIRRGLMQPLLTSPAGPSAGAHACADSLLTLSAPGSPSAVILGS